MVLQMAASQRRSRSGLGYAGGIGARRLAG